MCGRRGGPRRSDYAELGPSDEDGLDSLVEEDEGGMQHRVEAGLVGELRGEKVGDRVARGAGARPSGAAVRGGW
ncbi:hypothetical protein E2562_035277 [Oryza meyeriana var. granulata]|uniref:DUF834 domain-containing protein n=1 Tax=Oryza meyeriana var. granulata TaxID=110450 RepID=A0A6G1F1U8_9ORYZ|nr:hypothetical protein E2562_035277 [Oryza meyeriana var. granulata]